MIQVGMHEAKTNLSKLVQRAIDGEDVEITRNGEVVARIVPARKHEPSMLDCLGIWRDRDIRMDDPFAPMTEDELADWYGD